MGCPLFQESAMGNSVKSFTKVQVDSIHGLSFTHQEGHLVVKRDQVGQAGLALLKPVLRPDPLVVLYVLHYGTSDNLFHNLPWQ